MSLNKGPEPKSWVPEKRRPARRVELQGSWFWDLAIPAGGALSARAWSPWCLRKTGSGARAEVKLSVLLSRNRGRQEFWWLREEAVRTEWF